MATNAFPQTTRCLEDARRHLEALVASSEPIGFRSSFTAFVNAGRTITDAMQKEGKRLTDFGDWYAGKQAEMRADELLRWLHESRKAYFHEGDAGLRTSVYIEEANLKGIPSGTRITIGPDGFCVTADEGEPSERRVPVGSNAEHASSRAEYVVSVSLADPPTAHLGQQLTDWDPTSIARLALAYYERLVHEARTTFGVQ